jgi:hypothetical protein
VTDEVASAGAAKAKADSAAAAMTHIRRRIALGPLMVAGESDRGSSKGDGEQGYRDQEPLEARHRGKPPSEEIPPHRTVDDALRNSQLTVHNLTVTNLFADPWDLSSGSIPRNVRCNS